MRKIDSKFHIDDNLNIVKTSNGDIIPMEEPLFLCRGRDHLMIALLEFYKLLCKADGCNEYQLEGVELTIQQFKQFKLNHPDRMKQPGITRGK